jgi:hypothetical protein
VQKWVLYIVIWILIDFINIFGDFWPILGDIEPFLRPDLGGKFGDGYHL